MVEPLHTPNKVLKGPPEACEWNISVPPHRMALGVEGEADARFARVCVGANVGRCRDFC